ncbi:hypothetical protein NQ317_016173 [Molorchus minor]|uniref:Uncharacterized protein n=1 Tax=Molorchus minor TaxID=1323400 RepID=A0ABQ9JRD9_9CUCU|nr:hypothetical protein NQ317_016173 [Molorchus minor]
MKTRDEIEGYDTTFGRSRSDVSKKADETSRIASKYGSSFGTGYQRDIGTVRDTGYIGRPESSRIKPVLDKRDTSHPPVTYKTLNRSGARSREPSPIDKSEKSSSSSSSYSYNRLYTRPYQKTESTPTSTIPKYTGRTSIGREDTPKYGGRSSISKEDSLPKYKVSSRNPSKEDLSSGSQKYISSRFLPKNSVEKSYTAYSRPSTVRTNETSRKNRELLSVLHAQQEQERLSRSSSRCSSIAADDSSLKERVHADTNPESPSHKEIEMETVTVITRSTSPTPTTQNMTFLRSRRIEIAKLVEKQITRPKKRIHSMVDREMQSDRLDDSTKYSRFAGASRITATPWSSILDMKFSSPGYKEKAANKADASQDEKRKDICDSPKSLSRTSSTKSVSQSSSKSEKIKEVKKSPSPIKSRIVPPKQISGDKKQLPPQIPKNEASSKSNSLHSLQSTNKDFRKSVLNMNPDGTLKKKMGRRSNSASSAESDVADADVTDISENLTSCKSYHNSPSKLPQKISPEKFIQRCRRSPSSDASTSSHATSSSEDDTKSKYETSKHSPGSSRTSIVATSADELSTDKSPKPPHSPRQKSEAEAKSFLMRALAPVTSLFKANRQDSSEKVNWMDTSSGSSNNKSKISPPKSVNASLSVPSNTEPIPAKLIIHRVEPGDKPWWGENSDASIQDQQASHKSNPSENSEQNMATKPVKLVFHRVDSGEKAWWMEGNSEASAKDQNLSHTSTPPQNGKFVIKRVASGETPWWLDENAEAPAGVETYPNWVREDGTTADGKVIYKIRKNDSGDTSWWLSNSEKTSTESSNNKPTNIMDEEYLEKHKIRHIDSGERAWWLSSSENVSEMVQPMEKVKQSQPKFAIRHQDSGEKSWWLQQSTAEDNTYSENEFDQERVPLGDRASPEGLEMPKDDEGRKSPYDNVPETRYKPKRPTQLFISKHTNIDEILGGTAQIWSPLMDRIFHYGKNERDECTEIDAEQVIIHDSTPQKIVIQPNRM